MRALPRSLLALAAVLFIPTPAVLSQGLFSADPGPAYTNEQALRGQPVYAQACQTCHGATLEGTQFGPALKGAVFEGHWRGRPRTAFSERIRTTMPPGRLGSLSGEAYTDIEAYVIRSGAGAAAALPVSGAGDTRSTTAQAQTESSGMMGAIKRSDNDPLYWAAVQSHAAKLSGLTLVTDAALRQPPPGDWTLGRRTYDGLGYSPLRQIDRSNVQRLRAAWSWVLPQSVNEITPLVHDGVLFVSSGPAVQALDGASGDLLWQYTRAMSAGPGFGNSSHGRAMAIYGDRLFAPTADGHLIALEARTGHLVWDHEIIPSGVAGGGLQLNSAPIIVKGTVIIGVSLGVANPGGCFIVGLDAGDGKEKWRFHTIAHPGQPGGDSWNGAPVQERFGAGVWTIGSYDPELDLVYFGIGNTYDTATLLEPRAGATTVSLNDGLYTDSTVALHPDTGALAWYYQHQKRDVWDLDWVFEQSLVNLKVNGQARRLVVTGGKTALFDAVDAKTGAYVFSIDVGLQNLVTKIDPVTGEKTMNPAIEPEAGKAKIMCPNSIGARNWPATAVNPDSGVLFVPVLENCADYTYTPRSASQTAQGGLDMHFSSRSPANHDGNFGRLVAIDLEKHRILWTHRQRIPYIASALATAGGLLFTGDVDRYFYAYDQATGRPLWRTRLDAAPESSPVTYSANGRQYVAVVAGSGSPMGAAGRAFVPEVVAASAGVTLVVFELPQ
jgi:alcohol dehydrogenase (cytochrome c)